MHIPSAKLEQVLDRFREVEARMSAASDGAEIVRLSREHAELRPVAEAVEALARGRAERADLEVRVVASHYGQENQPTCVASLNLLLHF